MADAKVLLPSCLVNSCREESTGLVMINTNKPVMTIMMLPMCAEHGAKAKTEHMIVTFLGNDDPSIVFTGDSYRYPADVTLTYEAL